MRKFTTTVFLGFEDIYYFEAVRDYFGRFLEGWRAHYRVGWPGCDAWTRKVVEAYAAKFGWYVVWDQKGRFVRLLSGWPEDRVYPLWSEFDNELLEYWKQGVEDWRDMG